MPAAAYEPGFSARTYRRLAELAESHQREGDGVIVDATYRRAVDRGALRKRLEAIGAPLLFVECRAPTDVRRERASRRAASPSVSDADPAVAERLAAEFEPLDDLPSRARVVVRTDLGPAAAVAAVERAIDARWASRDGAWRAAGLHPAGRC